MSFLAGLPRGHLDQIGIVVPDLKTAMEGYIATMGATFQVFEVDESKSSFSGSSSSFRIRFAVAMVGLSSIELIQPLSGSTIYSDFLANRGPGIHHIGVYVPSLATAKRSLTRRGYPPLMEGRIRGLGRFGYFEASDMHCIIELLQLSLELPLFLAKNATQYAG